MADDTDNKHDENDRTDDTSAVNAQSDDRQEHSNEVQESEPEENDREVDSEETDETDRQPPSKRRQETTTDNRPFYVIMVLLCLIAIWLIISSLLSDSGTDVEVQPEEEAAVVQTVVAPDAITSVAYPVEQFYVTDQVIVSGPASAVETARGRAGDYAPQLEARLPYGQLLPPDNNFCPGLSDRANYGQDLVTELWSFTETSDRTVTSIIDLIDNPAAGVSAEPNRISGSPWEIEGSPWEIEGSPWEIEGGSDGSSDVMAAAEAVESPKQWAFEEHGIELSASSTEPRPTGVNILVGVFDTQPFLLTPGDPPRPVMIDWVDEPKVLTLTAYNPETVGDSSSNEDEPGSSMINHGLFVAGLVHAVAPDSEIELIRVLDENNRGDLFALNQAFFDFMQRASNVAYEGAVINMSLGIRIPPLNAPGFTGLTREVHSLRDLVALARCSRTVVVAAAGNNSAKSSTPELPNLPAAWSSVIGVAASNINKGRSCFSNLGDIGAPGGDGRETNGPTEICRPRNHECLNGDCPFAVVGPISQTLAAPSGFAYWTGSSFAAPMVSGLAARVLEAGNGAFSPADVRAIIECGATASNDRYIGAGVINVRRTLEECVPLFSEVTAQ